MDTESLSPRDGWPGNSKRWEYAHLSNKQEDHTIKHLSVQVCSSFSDALSKINWQGKTGLLVENPPGFLQ